MGAQVMHVTNQGHKVQKHIKEGMKGPFYGPFCGPPPLCL